MYKYTYIVYIYSINFVLSYLQSLLPNKIYNTHLIISDDGIEIGKYRKLHLFDVDIKNGPVILESTGTAYGDHIISPISTPLGEVGMAVCYDLRFPELSTELRKRGADILTYPSAFTVKTGQAHWGNYTAAKIYQRVVYG